MPQSIAIASFVFGAVLLLIAFVGGKFKIFGVEVSETAGRAGRVVAGAIGTVLIVIGLFAAFQPPYTSPTPPLPPKPHSEPGPKTTTGPDTYDPSQSFISALISPESRNPLNDPRIREAIRLVLQGEDLNRARKLMWEAGWPNGFSLNLALSRFMKAGGSEGEANLLIGKLRTIGVRVEKIQ